LTLKEIAKAGVFNLPNCTPLQSAQRANLWEAFTFLSAENAEIEYQNNYQEELQKRAKLRKK
jgi:hypothetical protein